MRILYLMHVNWNWIKQRPHFVAEYLHKYGFEVDVYYPKSYRKGNLVNNSTTIKTINSIPRLPFSKNYIIEKINKIIYGAFIRKILRNNNYDYVYVTHPSMYCDGIKEKIIYDCMDDCVAFPIAIRQRKSVLKAENNLIRRSSIVLFSADHLSDVVRKRYGFTLPVFKTINNAINLPKQMPNVLQQHNPNTDNKLTLSYIGTISAWFDFDLLKKVQELYNDKQIIFNLYGPCENVYKFDFVNFKGLVRHEMIFDVMEDADVLIMPFLVNDLIKSVNPVKLYEYIYSGKPVISVRYSETEKFDDYVYLYENNNPESFIEQLNKIKENKYQGKSDVQKAHQFVESNTWEHRVKSIINIITHD